MRKANLITLFLILALLIAACQPAPAPTQPPQPTVDVDSTVQAGVAGTQAAMPTEPPPPTPAPSLTPLPTQEPAPTVSAEMVSYTPSLTGVIWEWLGSTTAGQFSPSNDPSRYQVEFLADGNAQIKADCNNILATYTVEGQNLTITLGPTTLVACPEDSQADLFTQQIGAAASYSFEPVGNLILSLADGSAMSFSPQPIAVLPAPTEGEPSLTATANLNVRSGPSESYPVYGVMPVGRTAILAGKSEDGGWWVVSLPLAQGGIGWVSASFSTVTGGDVVPVFPTPPLPDQVTPVVPGEDDPQATTLSTVYVRQGPGENYATLGSVPAGVTGLVIGRSQDSAYWVVRVDPAVVSVGFAWVEAKSTSAKNVDNMPVIQAPSAPEPVQTNCYVDPSSPYGIATTAVNLREGPSTDYPVVGVAQQGQCGMIIGKNQDGSWWAVSTLTLGNVWVSATYVNAFNAANVPVLEAPPPPEPLPTPPPPAQPAVGYVITTEPLNVRVGPGNEYPSLGKVPAGTVFQVLGSANGWLNVAVPGIPAAQGWISGNYVVPYSAPVATPY